MKRQKFDIAFRVINLRQLGLIPTLHTQDASWTV